MFRISPEKERTKTNRKWREENRNEQLRKGDSRGRGRIGDYKNYNQLVERLATDNTALCQQLRAKCQNETSLAVPINTDAVGKVGRYQGLC